MADRLFIAVVRLPSSEVSYLKDALKHDAEAMMAVGDVMFADYPIGGVSESDLEAALRVLGVWGGDKFVV